MPDRSDASLAHRAAFEPDALRSALADHVPGAERDAMLVVRAPGRVNLIGEHTDYNLGLVLPAAIDLEIRIALVPTDDRRVELTRLDTGERLGFDLDAIGPKQGEWIDYVAGTAWALTAAGHPVRGLRGVIASTLPISSGLSSSAALELASAWALRDATRDGGEVDARGRMELAQIAQRAENEYVGVRTGLMDQFASSLGRHGAAMLLDCRSLEYREVPMAMGDHALVVCDTTSPRRLASSEYNARRAQCEHAVAVIAESEPNVRSLRDVDMALLERFSDRLDEETRRRCEHVIRENARVITAVAAFEAGDLDAVGDAFEQSHASLRDLYNVTSAELNTLVDIARGVPGTRAARMTGAGFGGCTVNIVATDSLEAFRARVTTEYPARTGLPGAVYVVQPADGAGRIE
jgi:galactokinase